MLIYTVSCTNISTVYLLNHGVLMKIVNYSDARANLRKILDEVEKSNEPTCVTSKVNQVVIISKRMYDEMIEAVK